MNELYTRYLRFPINETGHDIGPGTICHFSDSTTFLGIRIGGKVCLTLNEAIEQCDRWSEKPSHHRYVVCAPEDIEAGTTPLLPGMTDRDLLPRTRAGVGHVVGQGGCCWCGEHHADAVFGDPVSLPDSGPGWA